LVLIVQIPYKSMGSFSTVQLSMRRRESVIKYMASAWFGWIDDRDYPLMSYMGCVTGLPPGFGWTARETNTREAKPGFLQLYHSLRLNPPTDASCTSITTNHFTWAVYYSMTSLSAGTYHNFLDFAAGVPSRKSVAWISLIPRESRTRTNAAARRLSRTIRDNRHVSSVKSVALGKL